LEKIQGSVGNAALVISLSDMGEGDSDLTLHDMAPLRVNFDAIAIDRGKRRAYYTEVQVIDHRLRAACLATPGHDHEPPGQSGRIVW